MADLSYVLFDTAPFGNAAGVEMLLFQVQQGGDSTHTEQFTNMRGPGFLPQKEIFVVDKISSVVDVVLAEADVQSWFRATFLEIRLNNQTYLKIPIVLTVDGSLYGGHFTQAAAANRALIGVQGDGYELKMPIKIEGQQPFVVRILQGTALAAANQFIKVCLHGVYSGIVT